MLSPVMGTPPREPTTSSCSNACMAIDIVIGIDSLALVVAIGLALTAGVLVPAAGFAWDDRIAIERMTRRLFSVCIGVLWLTSLAWLWTRTAAMAGQSGWAVPP